MTLVFSLVIPCYNEQQLLPRLLDSVDVARRTYRGGPQAVEVIVADNASTDGTAAIAAERGCRVVTVPKRSIAAARNGGAAQAGGEILCFTDADARIHPETFNVIEEELSTGRIVAGATGIRPERWSLGFAATYVLLVPVVALMRMDTGVVFCRREDFIAVGGYDERRLFAEDVVLLFALRSLGRSRGQRLTRATRAKAIASMRKFDHFGDWHYFAFIWKYLMLLLFRKGDFSKLADHYWYRPPR